MFESVYHGVPLVTMPVFCDHDVNAAKAVADGYALRLELETLTSDKLSEFYRRFFLFFESSFGHLNFHILNNHFLYQIVSLRLCRCHFSNLQSVDSSVKGILKVIHDERYRQAVK